MREQMALSDKGRARVPGERLERGQSSVRVLADIPQNQGKINEDENQAGRSIPRA